MTITSFSQSILNDTVLITSNQLKIANLIFAEHQKLLTENSLLKIQLDNYNKENIILLKTDSLRVNQIEILKSLSTDQTTQIENLNNQLKKKSKSLLIWKVGGISVSCCLFLWLLVK